MKKEASSPLLSKEKISVLVDQCRNLRKEVRSSYEALKDDLTVSMSLFEQVKRKVEPHLPATWREKSGYVQVRERIYQQSSRYKSLPRSQIAEPKDIFLRTEVSPIQTLLKYKRTTVDPHSLVSGDLSCRDNSRRDLAGSGDDSDFDESKDSKQLVDFIRGEIQTYDQALMRKMATYKLPTAAGLTTFSASKPLRQYLQTKEHSPTHRKFTQPLQTRKTLIELSSLRRNQRKSLKMATIQPSLEVARLAERYMPKVFRKGVTLNIRIPEVMRVSEWKGSEGQEV